MKKKVTGVSTQQIIESGGGAVTGALLSGIIKKQLNKANNTNLQGLVKYSGGAPILGGILLTHFAPKYANIGLGMIAAGGVILANDLIPAISINGGRFIVPAETISGQDVGNMANGLDAVKVRIAEVLKRRMAERNQTRGAAEPITTDKPGVEPGQIIKRHYSDQWENEDECM